VAGRILVDVSGVSTLRAALWFPPESRPAGRCAGLVFLHGMMESGVDGARQSTVGLGPELLARPDRWPFVVILPQKPRAGSEWEEHERDVLALLDHAIAAHGVDPERVGLTGISQGGHGAWELARRHPARFAALAPICGYPSAPRRGWSALDRLRDWNLDQARDAATAVAERVHALPVWAAHGDADAAVPVEYTDVVVDALRARGSAVEYARYPGIAHDSWRRAYGDGELADWLVRQLRAR
jgi:predicted peptidase